MGKSKSFFLLGLVLAACATCGDPETYDDRGYTKAPLERPGPFVRGETPSPMRQFGTPKQPRPVEVQLDSARSEG